jgi:transketolase
MAERGYFSVEELKSFRNLNSRLQGHPDMRKLPGIEMTTGSLAQGFGSSLGMAMGLRAQKSEARVYVLLGDGELNEGEVWESAMIAAHYKLDNLTAIIDKNGKQGCNATQITMDLGDLAAKWKAFGWHALEVDGHDHTQLAASFNLAKSKKGAPSVIVANTVKGKGIPFMEAGNEWYGEKLTAQDIARAKAELQARRQNG